MESINKKKFSRHLVFTNCIFVDQDACGRFVAGLPYRMSENEKKAFIIKDNNKKDAMFYDRGVYTRNRNFR